MRTDGVEMSDAVLSTRYPPSALISLRLGTEVRAGLWGRHRPRGPSTCPVDRTPFSCPGSRQGSKSRNPPRSSSTRCRRHDIRASGFRVLDSARPGDDRHPHRLARSVGQDEGPATIWSACGGRRRASCAPRRSHRYLAKAVVLDDRERILQLVGRSSILAAAARTSFRLLPCMAPNR